MGVVLPRKNKDLVASGDGDEEVGAEGGAEGVGEFRGEDTGGGEGVGGFEGGVADHAVLVAEKFGCQLGQRGGGGFQGLGADLIVGPVDGFFLLAGEGFDLAIYHAADGEEGAL